MAVTWRHPGQGGLEKTGTGTDVSLGCNLLLVKTNLVCGKADLEDGVEGLREEGADAIEAG